MADPCLTCRLPTCSELHPACSFRQAKIAKRKDREQAYYAANRPNILVRNLAYKHRKKREAVQ